MTSEFQESALQSLLERVVLQEGFKQPKFELGPGSKPGDNFIGRIYRVVVTETEVKVPRRLSLIIKASPISKLRQKMQSTNELFQTESDLYQIVLPTFNKLLDKYGIASSNGFPGTVRWFGAHISDPNSDDSHALVLEDKTKEGFQMSLGKDKLLDAEHCRYALEKVSLWHAASMALHHHDPETAKKLADLLRKDEIIYNNENHPMFDELIPDSLSTLKETLEHCKIENSAYKKTLNLIQNYRQELVNINQPSTDLFCVIQGDLWTNNILFKYKEDGTLEDACLLDFQFGRVTSPVHDIAYMLFLCTSKEVRDQHYQDLLRFYHDKLCSNLRKLNCDPNKIIPWQRLQEHLQKCGRIGVLIGLPFLPVFAAESHDIQVDVHGSQQEGSVFVGGANVTNPQKRQETLRRIADVIEDSCRFGYL